MVTLVIATPTAGHADPPGDVERQLNAASERLEKVVERFNANRADLARTRARMRAVTRQLRPSTSGWTPPRAGSATSRSPRSRTAAW
ncbi:hypothetical protein ACFQX7_17310 [Luedemannella flava]